MQQKQKKWTEFILKTTISYSDEKDLKDTNEGPLKSPKWSLFRYTIWIPLYPIGFICEGVIALRNIPYFEETEQFSVLLPNR